jgi:preprotein translocase subunit SecA
LRLALDRFADPDGGALLLRGLHYAIVDEADSVLVDEARTPLILSAPVRGSGQDQFLTEALKIARDLAEGVHFERRERGRDPVLTRAGRDAVAARAAELSGLWSGERRREEAIVQALSALYLFKRDVDYIVRDDKVQIVDENTGRVMPDRSWQRGLQQLIELCEGVPVTPDKQTLARISFQLFFRRYLSLAGMTGTCREVAGEIGAVYGVPVVRVPRNRRSRRRHLPPRLHARVEARWADVVERVRLRVDRGQPVLVGTRSIMASEELAARLARAGIDHQVLNAKQDEAEAAIVASAGGPRRVTIATNMAGRGTDIKLAAGVEAVGGLHVILTEGHDNARIDRQLIGRCARQGDPGSCESILSLEDELLSDFFPPLVAALRALLAARPRSWLLKRLGLICYRAAQRRVERRHRRIREELLRADLRTSRNLSFSGPTE